MNKLGFIALLILTLCGWYLFKTKTMADSGTKISWTQKQKPGGNMKLNHPWPPQVGQPYPDLKLQDQTGKMVQLSSFKGRVLLIEPIGMNCPACQAFAGAHKVGAYENIQPQSNLESVEEFFPKYTGGVQLSDERIVYIHLLLYSMSMQAPTVEDAKLWVKHFKLKENKNGIVLIGKKELIGPASYNLIPGFQLVDKNFILQADSTGHHPKDNLWTKLLPMVKKLL